MHVYRIAKRVKWLSIFENFPLYGMHSYHDAPWHAVDVEEPAAEPASSVLGSAGGTAMYARVFDGANYEEAEFHKVFASRLYISLLRRD